jgi:hypothetical protein
MAERPNIQTVNSNQAFKELERAVLSAGSICKQAQEDVGL